MTCETLTSRSDGNVAESGTLRSLAVLTMHVEWGTRASVYIPGVGVGSLTMARIPIGRCAREACAGVLVLCGAVLLGMVRESLWNMQWPLPGPL